MNSMLLNSGLCMAVETPIPVPFPLQEPHPVGHGDPACCAQEDLKTAVAIGKGQRISHVRPGTFAAHRLPENS